MSITNYWISHLTNHLFQEVTKEVILWANDFSTVLCILKGEVRGSGRPA